MSLAGSGLRWWTCLVLGLRRGKPKRVVCSVRRPAGCLILLGVRCSARVLRLGLEEHVVLVTMHHIVSDGWSLGVLIREVGSLYAAYAAGDTSPLPALAVQ